jgi:predicted transcriptional regulator
MKIRVALMVSTLLFGLVSVANAQLKAGSPEDEAYTKIEAEKNADAKLALLLDFEKKFPNTNNRTLATVYMMAMDIYSEKNEGPKIAEYGDKAITKDPDNVSALLRVSRNYSAERTNLAKAVEYAEKAKKLLGGMRSQPAPTGQTDVQWKQWLDANQSSAEEYSKYATMLLERQTSR